MTLKTKELLKMRQDAIVARKERYEKRQHEQIDSIKEIADKLKDTPMVKGIDNYIIDLFP